MAAIIDFVFFILSALLTLMRWAIIIYAIIIYFCLPQLQSLLRCLSNKFYFAVLKVSRINVTFSILNLMKQL